MKKKLNRRNFLKAGLLAAGGAAAVIAGIPRDAAVNGQSADKEYLSHVMRHEPPEPTEPPAATAFPPAVGAGGVVYVHSNQATTWNNTTLAYWDFVNQTAIDKMVDQGMMSMTGMKTVADAWKSLIPNYRSGEKVAIKVSFNNTTQRDPGNESYGIDSVPEPVNAIIRGLKLAGVPSASIVIFDSMRAIPKRFRDKIQDKSVVIKDMLDDPWGTGSQAITFRPPNHAAISMRVSKELVAAKYLINVPILKRHGFAWLSMGFKNHYGTISDPESIHPWTSLGETATFTPRYSPLVELNANANIAGKTILVVGDALFSAFHNSRDRSRPKPWVMYNNQTPKSLFFSRDPVAIDTVMSDLINYERTTYGGGAIPEDAFAHLALAQTAGLGIYERGNLLQNTYKKIKLAKLEV